MSRKCVAAAIHGSHSIRVTIRHQAEVVGMLAKPGGAGGVVFGNRFGVDSAKGGIVGPVQGGDLTAGAGEQFLETPGSHAIHRVVREAELGTSDQAEIHQSLDRFEVGRLDILDGYRSIPHGVTQGHRADGLPIQLGFDGLTHRGLRRPAEMRLELETVKRGRIVAGGNHHSAQGLLLLHPVGDGWRGRGTGGQDHLKSIGGEDFRGALRKLIREESTVVSDDDLRIAARDWVSFPVVSAGLSHAIKIREGKILRNDRSPTIGSEFDLRHWIRNRMVKSNLKLLGKPSPIETTVSTMNETPTRNRLAESLSQSQRRSHGIHH